MRRLWENHRARGGLLTLGWYETYRRYYEAKRELDAEEAMDAIASRGTPGGRAFAEAIALWYDEYDEAHDDTKAWFDSSTGEWRYSERQSSDDGSESSDDEGRDNLPLSQR